MTTLTSPLDQRVPQPHLQALRDSLKGEFHFPGDHQLSPTDKGKVTRRPAQAISTSNLRDNDAIFTTSVTPGKRRREAEEADDEERAVYEARLRTYNPAAPRVSTFLSGPPLAPEPGVSRRVPPQDCEVPRHSATNSTGSEPASTSIDTDHQYIDENLTSPPVDARGLFNHMDLAGESNFADVPRPTPWLPSRVRPFDYLATTDPSQDTGPIQPTYQQTMHSSRELTSFPTPASNNPFSEPTFPPLDIPRDLPISSLHSAEEGSSLPTSASSPFSPYLQMDQGNPTLDRRSQLEPWYPQVYVTFGAGASQKGIGMCTADNPVEVKEYANGIVELIPCHVPTYVHPYALTTQLFGCLWHTGLRILQDQPSWCLEGLASSAGYMG